MCTGTFSLTQSEYRQTDRQTDGQTETDRDRQTGAYAAVLPVGFPSPCPASETPFASASPHRRDTCDGSLSAEREREREEEGRRGEE